VPHGNDEYSRIWNNLMQSHHYLGAGPLCGSQVRYLIKSEQYGWLGGLSFSSATLRLQARDQMIGWSEAARQAHLNQVVNNSRFLTAILGESIIISECYSAIE